MRERAPSGTRLPAPAGGYSGGGIFDRRNAEFSTGVDSSTVSSRFVLPREVFLPSWAALLTGPADPLGFEFFGQRKKHHLPIGRRFAVFAKRARNPLDVPSLQGLEAKQTLFRLR